MRLAALMITAVCGLSTIAMADETNWCPRGGQPTDVLHCIEVRDTGQKNSWGETVRDFRNNCTFPVFLHFCTLDPLDPNNPHLRCSDPPKPTYYRKAMPTPAGADYWEIVDGGVKYWAVRCR